MNLKTEGGKVDPRALAEDMNLRTCRGCGQSLGPVVFIAENGAYDNADGSRPFLAVFGWCGCDLLRPVDPAGWRRVAGHVEGPDARAALEAMRSPRITTCTTCQSRVFPLVLWEPGARRWIQAGERCGCA